MTRPRLEVLDDEIDRRAAEVRRAAGDWPCKSGCSACCRSLAAPLLLSPEEWDRLERGLEALPEGDREEIRAGLDAMEDAALGGEGLTCPVLDADTGRCRLYAARPLVCRIHGYYADRSGGFWCETIDGRVQSGDADGVVFGHHEGITRAAARALGEPVTWSERQRARASGHTVTPSW